MTIKEYIDGLPLHHIMGTQVVQKLVELESIDRYLNVMLGVGIDVNIKPVEMPESRFYGRGIVEQVRKSLK